MMYYMDWIKSIWQKMKLLYEKGAFHIIGGTFATKFVAFFGSIFVVRLLSKEEYGILGYVENIYSYALIFAGFGISMVILRYVVKAQPQKKWAYFNYTVCHSVTRNTLIIIAIVIANFFVIYPDSFSMAKYYVPIAALILPFQDLTNIGLYSIRADFKNKTYAYLSTAVSSTLIIGRIIGAYADNVKGVLWSRVLINAISAIMLIWFASRLFIRSNAENIGREEKRELNIYAFQYMFTNGLWALFMLNDTFLLGLLCNDATVLADYKVAYVLPGNVSIFATAIGTFISPYFVKKEGDLEWVRKQYKIVFVICCVVVGLVVLMIGFLAKPLIVLLYGEQYTNVVGLMRMLLVASFFNSGVRYTSANLLSCMGEIRYNIAISIIGMLLQLILDILLIGRIGAYGVAIANGVVYAFMGIALFLVFYRKYYKKDGL